MNKKYKLTKEQLNSKEFQEDLMDLYHFLGNQ